MKHELQISLITSPNIRVRSWFMMAIQCSNIVRFRGARPRCEVYTVLQCTSKNQTDGTRVSWHRRAAGDPVVPHERFATHLDATRSSVAYVLPVKCSSSSTLPETRLLPACP